jgi:glutamyl-tRNA synthetase
LNKKFITRFAPSPTGLLHVGNTRTALINYLLALKEDGKFILRIDDTDEERSKDEFIDQIKQDLEWLEINFQEIFRQSERLTRYNENFEKLKENGLIYPCFEDPEELERKRKRLIERRKPPVYDRAALNLSQNEIAKLIDKGTKPYWRFKLSSKRVIFNDLVRGEVRVETSAQSDPVIKRDDGGYLYNLPSVVDDIDMGITHVVRGEDHVTNSAIQVEMFEALDKPVPIFGHHPMLVNGNGEPFSKRNAASSIKSLREKYLNPIAINSLNISIGTSIDLKPIYSMKEMAENFDIGTLGRAPARYSEKQLLKLNSMIVSSLSFLQLSDDFKELGYDINEDIWECIKNNIETLTEVKEWLKVIKGPIKNENKLDSEFMRIAEKLLPEEPWDETAWEKWVSKIKERTKKTGKDLFLPLRRAITGKSNGPELNKLIILIGYKEIRNRLKNN